MLFHIFWQKTRIFFLETLLLKEKKRNKTPIKMAKNHLEKSKNPAKEIFQKNS